MRRRRLATIFLLTVLAIVPSVATAQPTANKALTLELVTDGSLSVPAPSEIRWAPDGRLSYLLAVEEEEGESEEAAEGESAVRPTGSGEGEGSAEDEEEQGGRDLWVLDPATGEQQILVPAAVVRRLSEAPGEAEIDERERTRRSRFRVPSYLWSPSGEQILFTRSGQIQLYRPADGEVTVLAPARRGVRDPKFSPDGGSIAFVYDHDLWVVPVAGGDERRLTTGGREDLLHGDLDWVYPEELGVRTGYHFAPDGRHIAFLEMDQSSVPTQPITEELDWQATVDLQRYPKPGDSNPRVRVGMVNLETGRTAWLDRAAEYVPRIDWADGETLAVQLLNRGQDELELVLADPASGRSRSVFLERDDHWLDVIDDLHFLADGRLLWTSARTGLRHLYLYRRSGELVGQLTAGEYRVAAIQGVDEEGGWVYYSSNEDGANEDNLLGSDLYRVRLDGGGKERLTAGKGTHAITMFSPPAPQGALFSPPAPRGALRPGTTAWVDRFAGIDPGAVRRWTVHHLPSGKETELWRDRDLSDYGLVAPEMVELETADGALVRVLLWKPERVKRREKRPLLVFVYGMAGVPTIRDAWSSSKRNLFHQFLVQQGYLVAHVDDRSSSIPGHKYATLADHDLGPVMAADMTVAVDYFRSLPYVDPDRLAVWGWSGGGFSTAFLLGHSDYFKVGIAGAPVTDWRLYDSIYTERYMGLPEEDPEAYERTSALAGAKDLHGRLLLIHGTHDDNVHPQNSLKMVDELIKARKQFDLMLYPGKTHGITGVDHNAHLYTLIYEYLERHL